MIFSRAVMCDHRLKCWNTIDSRERMRCSCFGSPAFKPPPLLATSFNSSLFSRILPAKGCSSRLMQRRKVLLPEPLEPMMLITSPALAASDTPLSTSFSPKRLWISRATSLTAAFCATADAAFCADESNAFSPEDGSDGSKNPPYVDHGCGFYRKLQAARHRDKRPHLAASGH